MKKILIVDDEYLIRYSLSTLLKDSEIEVKTAATGKDALKEISGASYDVCMIDIHLPDMSGLDIMKTVKNVSPATKIIIMTGSEVTTDQMKSICGHADLFLTKPFDVFEVETLVRRLIEGEEDIRGVDAPRVHLPADEKRRFRRTAVARTIAVSLRVPDGGEMRLTADVLDISDAGMGVLTTCSLEVGRTLRFKSERGHAAGIVRWSRGAGTTGPFRGGILFL